jgi:hypothetical protein
MLQNAMEMVRLTSEIPKFIRTGGPVSNFLPIVSLDRRERVATEVKLRIFFRARRSGTGTQVSSAPKRISDVPGHPYVQCKTRHIVRIVKYAEQCQHAYIYKDEQFLNLAAKSIEIELNKFLI